MFLDFDPVAFEIFLRNREGVCAVIINYVLTICPEITDAKVSIGNNKAVSCKYILSFK